MKQFALSILSFCYFHLCFSSFAFAGVEILSKSKVQRCEKGSGSDELNCTRKVVLNMAVPSGTSGRDSSVVAEIVEVEENSTDYMQTLRTPPVITINKSAAYALYQLTYIRDVAYKPVEYYVKTRKCEPDANEHVVKICERPVLLQDENGHVIQHSEPICCPCGPRRRVPSSCGNFFDKLVKGKANTAHCVRFPGDWFHVFGIGQRSVGFSVKIEVKVGSTVSEVILGPENRTATSKDNFLRVNLIGDFVGYSSIPSFEDFYLVVPRQGDSGQQELGRNFSMWMLLERVRFTLDGVDCNKVGVSYEAFSGQSDFCSSPYWSCLHNQLWNFWNVSIYIYRHILDSVVLTSFFQLIRFNLSPGKIVGVTVPTFETLTQFGIATITAQNIGEVEASYSLTEQFFIMKPNEIATQSFKLYPTTDQAASYVCSAILKDSNFNEVDRANCQFSTTATTLDNGSQIGPFMPPGTGHNGFLEFFRTLWNKLWEALSDFITGETCREKCSGFFDFRCHIQYICFSWMMMFGLLLAIFPTVLVLIWLLHQKGFFDPLYDWWEDHLGDQKHRRHDHNDLNHHIHHGKKHHHHGHHHKHGTTHHRRRSIHVQHNKHLGTDADYNYYHLHHVNKDRSKHHKRRSRKSSVVHDARLGEMGDDCVRHHGHRGKRERRGGRS
ncbi:Protein HAPLESS 2 [Linum perenne]